MPTDFYTKTVLTIIAGALVVIAWQGALRPAGAQMGAGCGSAPSFPCYVAPSAIIGGMPVSVTNWPLRY